MEESGVTDERLKALGGLASGAARGLSERYWLVHPNGGRQLIDPSEFDLSRLAEQARRMGGQLVVESETAASLKTLEPPALERDRTIVNRPPIRFEPPISALGALFRSRLDRTYRCLVDYDIDINTRPTTRVLGGYYKSRNLVRVYSHDRATGRRPLEELFDTFLHEIAHHIEYTEPDSFHARECERVPGRMHSRLFWRILGEVKGRWADSQRSR
ncbi:MAG: hypothetical protein NVSMB9_23890 [Isosphaeraceae bacterium]